MNRGSPSATTSATWSRSGFNEAPIHESGKYVMRMHARHGIQALQ